MKRFLARVLLYSIPFQVLVAAFVVLDPFKVVHHYEAFRSHDPVSINVDYLSTETYLRNRTRLGYDSFIFGSSRTLAFRTGDWRAYLEQGSPFRFCANAESVYGVWSKIRWIDRLGDPIANVLLLVDEGLLREVHNSRRHLYIKHPRLSNESWASFYTTFFNAFLSDFFFVKYLDYRLFGRYRGYMEGAINRNRAEIDPVTNDVFPRTWEEELAADPEAYYARRQAAFERGRSSGVRVGEPVVHHPQLAMLREIRSVFAKHGTRYRIVVSPNFDQVPLNRADLLILRQVFGPENVFDFSGRNDITADIRNYYDPGHFRPFIGRRILEEIYRPAEPGQSVAGRAR